METLAIVHAIAFLVAIGYAQNYYFHLRKLKELVGEFSHE